MFGAIASTVRTAAPFAGSAVVTGTKALAGFAIATKAGVYAREKAEQFLDDLSLAREAVRTSRETPDNVVSTQERKIS